QPSFDTGTSASWTPVIAATAASKAWATAACDTITPRSGSLIVFLEILLELAALGETLEQPVVEQARRIHAAVPQQVVHRNDLTDHGQVLPRVERYGDDRQSHLEHLSRLAVDPGAVIFARRLPVFELDDDLDPLLLAHGTDAEQRADVDQPHAADLHVVLGQFVPAPDQDIVAPARNVNHVVRNQPVAALHQIEDAFAFPDARAAEEQQAHTEHIGERRVHGGRGREGLVQKGLEAAVELRGLESRPDHRDALGARPSRTLGFVAGARARGPGGSPRPAAGWRPCRAAAAPWPPRGRARCGGPLRAPCPRARRRARCATAPPRSDARGRPRTRLAHHGAAARSARGARAAPARARAARQESRSGVP